MFLREVKDEVNFPCKKLKHKTIMVSLHLNDINYDGKNIQKEFYVQDWLSTRISGNVSL